jgi:hypothetical protein
MTAELERGYRRWLRCYPEWFRRQHEAEVLAVLMTGARADQRRPDRAECLDLVRGAIGMRLRVRVPGSNRSMIAALRLMYLGAAIELATAFVVIATMGDVRSAIATGHPGYTAAQWHTEVADSLVPLIVGAGIAAGLWLWLAWANGRPHRWARVVFALFFCLNTYSLFNGMARGSAADAPADLACGTVLCLVQLAALVLLARTEFHRPTDRGPA